MELSESDSQLALCLCAPGGVLPVHAGAFRDTKWENWEPGHGGGRFDLSPRALRHDQQTAGGDSELRDSTADSF